MRERPGRKSRGSFSNAQESSRPPNEIEEDLEPGSSHQTDETLVSDQPHSSSSKLERNVTFGKGALSRMKSHKDLRASLADEEDSESMRERPGRKSRGSFSSAHESNRPANERPEPRQILAAAKGRGAGADQTRPSVGV